MDCNSAQDYYKCMVPGGAPLSAVSGDLGWVLSQRMLTANVSPMHCCVFLTILFNPATIGNPARRIENKGYMGLVNEGVSPGIHSDACTFLT